MAIKPILFNTEMVRANLDGRKSCIRRLVKGFVPDDAIWGYTAFTPKGYISCRGTFADGYGEKFFKLPYQPGDIIYVRETWYKGLERYMYRADYSDTEKFYQGGKEIEMKWHPSIRMPKEAARIWLKCTDVRVERLQEITESGAKAEGIRGYTKDGNLYKYAVTDDWWIDYHNKHKEIVTGTWWQDMPRTAKDAFSYLWNSTIKKSDLDLYGWNANPWVWTIEYERCEKPEGV
jgi:hypothetical protein